MKSKSLLKPLMAVAVIGLLFTACKKKTSDLDNDTSAAGDNALAESSYNDVHNIADQASTGSLASYDATYNSGSNEKGLLSACATVAIDTSVSPHTITVNFGTTNCLCSDGRYRRGTILISYSGHYRDSASVHTITFPTANPYFVNDNQILGTKTVTNMGHNAAGHSVFNINVNGTIIKANGGGTVTWTSQRQREWIQGESTMSCLDDVYLVTGSASGTNAHGNSFTAQITSALERKVICRQFVSGTFTLTPSGKATRTFDFGNGACDDIATVTINGNVYTITLP